MRPLVYAQLICDTENDANQVLSRAQTAFNRLTLPAVEVAPTVIPWHGRWLVQAVLRCATQADADDFYTQIVAAWASGPVSARIKTGSFVKRTNNYDDEGLGQPDYDLYSLTK